MTEEKDDLMERAIKQETAKVRLLLLVAQEVKFLIGLRAMKEDRDDLRARENALGEAIDELLESAT